MLSMPEKMGMDHTNLRGLTVCLGTAKLVEKGRHHLAFQWPQPLHRILATTAAPPLAVPLYFLFLSLFFPWEDQEGRGNITGDQ